MRDYIAVLFAGFLLVSAIGCGSNTEGPGKDIESVTDVATGGERLKPVTVSRVGTLTVYEDEGLTRPVGELSADEIITVDTINRDYSAQRFESNIRSEDGLSGYVDFRDLVEIRTPYVKKLNVRDKPSTSGNVIKTLARGEPIIIVQETRDLSPPDNEDGIDWREIRMDGTTGWVADDYIIEKRFYDILGPAIEKYDSGDTSGLGSYLDDIASQYVDVE